MQEMNPQRRGNRLLVAVQRYSFVIALCLLSLTLGSAVRYLQVPLLVTITIITSCLALFVSLVPRRTTDESRINAEKVARKWGIVLVIAVLCLVLEAVGHALHNSILVAVSTVVLRLLLAVPIADALAYALKLEPQWSPQRQDAMKTPMWIAFGGGVFFAYRGVLVADLVMSVLVLFGVLIVAFIRRKGTLTRPYRHSLVLTIGVVVINIAVAVIVILR